MWVWSSVSFLCTDQYGVKKWVGFGHFIRCTYVYIYTLLMSTLFMCLLFCTEMCFQDAMFPLLARMRGGLYYNTYLLPGCRGSGLMQTFSKHLLSRLGIGQEPSVSDIVRITFLSRSTKHRRIVNEDQVCGTVVVRSQG